MKVNRLNRRLALATGLGAVLLCIAACTAVSETVAAGPMAYSKVSGGPGATAALPTPSGEVVMEWNQHAVKLALAAPPVIPRALAPVEQARAMAVVQAAVHDAVNGITGEYATYLQPGTPPANASPEASAIAAAHHALRDLYASQSASLDTHYMDSLASRGLSEDDPGIEYGRAAAAAILAARANDLSAQARYPYSAPGAGTPGVWVPISGASGAQALLPGWGSVTPFVLRSGSQFRPEPPPALDGERYARDYNEVKEIGRLDGSTRTNEQTQIASFWRASPTAIWNPVIRQVVAARNPDLSATARTFALVYLAVADASIACWEAKYTYNYWRPEPAIRNGDSDGNDLTAGDPTWTPLFGTPPHPEYTSGHATNSSAMASILESLFGDHPGVQIEVTLPQPPPAAPITRRWDTFGEGVEEVIDARVYSGIHFRTSDEVGARVGRQVARFVLAHALRPCPKGRPSCS